jgi:hypothetical protein
MSKTASIRFATSVTLLGWLIAILDRVRMANAEIAARNDDLPYFGL